MNKKNEIDKNGWLLVKSVFSPEEIESFRALAIQSKDHQGDVLSHPKLKKVLMDERVLNIFKEALGSDSLFYFGDSLISINGPGGGFHKDSPGRMDKKSFEWKDPNYSVVRMGIYLQDHSKHSYGLCLREKSHLTQSVAKGKIINVKTEPGDVVLWKLTTTHAANALVLAALPQVSFHPLIARMFPKLMLQPKIEPRVAIFTTFGIDDHYSREFVNYLKTRKYAVNRWEHTHYGLADIEDMKSKGVDVLTDFQLEVLVRSELV